MARVLPMPPTRAGDTHKFLSSVTATGSSSNEPNLQNIPVRTEVELRRYFIPEDGYVLLDADYSQIELRILAAISGDETMMQAFHRGADIHTATAAEVFRVPEEYVTREMRSRAKAVNFGIVYGIGEFSLARDIGTSRKVAAEYIQPSCHLPKDRCVSEKNG